MSLVGLVRRQRSLAAFLSLLLFLLFATSASAQSSGSIAGRVTDSVTRRPVEGVTVTLIPSYDYSVTLTAVTDSRGRYRFDGLPAGNHVVSAVTSAGYIGGLSDGRPCFRGLTFSERFGFRCDGALSDPPLTHLRPGEAREVPFALDRGGEIAGRVTADGVAAAAQVVITPGSGEVLIRSGVGADGGYRAGPLPAGVYRVLTDTAGAFADEVWDGIHCDGRNALYNSCDPRRGAPVAVRLRHVTGGIDFELERLGVIAGRITDAATGEPLAGVDVFARRDPLSRWFGTTGADGHYEVAGLLAGEFRVYTLEAAEHVDELYDGVPCPGLRCDEAEGVAVPVVIDQVTGGVDFALDRGATISGRVTAADSGEPLAGVHVRLHGRSSGLARYTSTGGDGGFRIAALPADAYEIHTFEARNLGFADEAWGGEACGLAPAHCAVEIAPVSVALGEERNGLDFALEPLGVIAGRVVDAATGAPVAGLPLIVHDPRGGIAFARTESDGDYVSEPLPRGSYTLATEGWPSPSEYVDQIYDGIPCFLGRCDPARGTPVEVLSGATRGGVDFALSPGGAIVGRVTREESGEPASGIYVSAVDPLGRFAASDLVDAEGSYRLRGLPDGDYYLSTTAFLELIDEVHDGIQCVRGSGLGCAPLEGAPVRTEAGASPPAVDFALAESFRPGTPCRQGPNRLCLAGGRFEVGIGRFTAAGGGLGRRRPISDSAGAFTLFADDNVEAVVRVVDGCDAFDRFWVLAASLGQIGVEAGVRDTVTGEARFYPGLDFEPALDTGAFATCDAGPVPAPLGSPISGRSGAIAPETVPDPAAAPAATVPATGSAGTCVPGSATLCLLGGRFAVAAEWDDGVGGSGAAGASALGDRSGYLWFHRPGSPEVAVKIIDACTLDRPGHWVFASGLTTSEVHLTVTDTVSGEILEVVNLLGQVFSPVRELGFFGASTCPPR